jgi:serine/threonine protein kinase
VETKQEWEKIKELFAAALERDPSERAAFLQAACGTEMSLRQEVESLIKAHQSTSNLWQHPLRPQSSENTEGRLIGSYQLLKKIGEGGMGQVWLAQQIAPLQRQVALKLIRWGTYDDTLLHRFQAERQSLAVMDHPSIAKVFDAGATAEGQPYFVMEYVAGLPITDYCDQKRLKIRDRLELFIKVCEAVQHAHQKAIIHRDLKPANILVIEMDGEPVPRIIDFGLAKATDAGIAGESGHTRLGSFVGTPGYMSPEQCDPAAQDVDTRTDVYSLGVVLYVLLAGNLPFDTQEWKNKPLDEMLRRLREEEPPRPSAKVSTDRDTSSATAEARGTEPRQLVRVLSGDLDWITMKAVEKDRARRYVTPSELAADIGRYLNNEPVTARRATFSYRLQKYVRRQWMPVTALTLVILTLSGGLFEINRQRVIAERRFAQLRQLSNRVFDLDKTIRNLPGSTEARQSLVSASVEYLEGLAADAHGDLDLAREVGEGYWRIARMQGVPVELNLGDPAKAEVSLKKADALIETVLASRPNDRSALLLSAAIAHDRMILAANDDRNADAVVFARRAAGRLDAYLLQGNVSESDRKDAAGLYANLAIAYTNMHLYSEALPCARRCVELARSLPPSSHRLATGLSLLADLLRYQGDLEGALRTIQEARKAGEQALYENETVRMVHMQNVLLLQGLILGEDGGVSLGRTAEAVEPLQKAFDMVEEAARKDPHDALSRGRAGTGTDLGDILRHLDPERALAVYDLAIRRFAEIPNNSLDRDRARALANSSYPLRRLHRAAEAKQRIDLALAILKEAKAYPAERIKLNNEVYLASCAQADYEAEEGDPRRAVQMYEQLLDKVMAAKPEPLTDLRDATRMSGLYQAMGILYRRTGETSKAESMQAQRLELWRQWDQKLPNSSFVRRQLEAASLP